MKNILKHILLFLLFFSITGVFVLVLVFLVQYIAKDMIRSKEHREIEEVLGVPLPNTASNIRYYKNKPYIVAYPNYDAYIRFDASEEVYIQLVNDMGMEWAEDSQFRALYWTGRWKAPAQYNLEWWNPTLESPEMAAIGVDGPGVVVAIFEDGRIFIHRRT